jgi:uncharacterized protein involved in cysteine biosynthesis
MNQVITNSNSNTPINSPTNHFELIKKTFHLTFSFIKSSPLYFIFTLLSCLFALGLYVGFALILFGPVKIFLINEMMPWIQSSQWWGTFLAGFITAILAIIFIFLFHTFYVMTVSLMLSPFNDYLSEKAEDFFHKNRRLMDPLYSSILKAPASWSFGRILKVIRLEIKKFIFLGLISLLNFFLSLIPIFIPFCLLVPFFLMSFNYLNYLWSRYELPLSRIARNLRTNWIPYLISGVIFSLLLNIPLLGVLFIPFSVIYFTLLELTLEQIPK